MKITEKRRKRKRKGEWEGSYTIEAVFVVPLILGIIFAWMFEMFYFHDRVVLGGILQEQLINKTVSRQEVPVEKLQNQLQKKLWLLEITSLKEKERMGKNTYRARARSSWNIPVMGYFLKGILDFYEERSCYSKQPDYRIRFR